MHINIVIIIHHIFCISLGKVPAPKSAYIITDWLNSLANIFASSTYSIRWLSVTVQAKSSCYFYVFTK